MQKEFSYKDYVSDANFLDGYNAYQRKYSETIRESDRVIIDIVREIVSRRSAGTPLKLLDIGCSTGNLLLHLKRLVTGLELYGGDLAQSSLELCRGNKALSGITFGEMDILDIQQASEFDIIVANAVAVYFTWAEYEQTLRSVYRALKSNGAYIVFEWMHPYQHQDLVIYETSIGHPDGIRICYRPILKVTQVVQSAGFSDVKFLPFVIPIDLPNSGYDGEVVSYTVKDEIGERMTFRGALYQPWCHMVAYKGSGRRANKSTSQ